MACRSADHERWKSLDFVVGIEIQTSNNHTTKDSRGGTKPLEDICDTLAGRYPKDFKFVGWHPHCRCIATTILKTEEEMERDTERIMDGEEPLPPNSSRNYIGELPEKFTKWLDKNAERIANAKSLPYFLKDNQGLIDGATNGPEISVVAFTPNIKDKDGNDVKWEFHLVDKKHSTDREILDNIFENYDHYWGTASSNTAYARSLVDDITTSSSMIAGIRRQWQKILTKMLGEDGPNYQSVNHFKELMNVRTEDIPVQWRNAYNDLIGKLNKHDFVKDGYGAVYNEIEGAYNIYMLAKDPTVISMGLGNVSIKTPYNFFTEYVKAYPDWINHMPPKEFFDKLDKFYPLVQVDKKVDAYFSPSHGYVNIHLGGADNKERLKSSVYQKEILVHEYGHAMDNGLKLTKNADFRKIYDDWRAEIAKDNGAQLENKINDKWNNYDSRWETNYQKQVDQMNDYYFDGKNKEGDELRARLLEMRNNKEADKLSYREMVGSLSDCLEAALEGKRCVKPLGHGDDYFKSREKQLAEFFAHASENYWMGNTVFEELDPDLYKKLMDFMRGKMSK